ncbi:MAG: recombinase family protein [Streptosporangiaceae bacterium]
MRTAPAPASADTIRAATYSRISLAERKAAEDGAKAIPDAHGVLNQGTVTGEHADAKGWPVVARYCDNDVTASSGKHDSAEYWAMMAAAARGEFDVIVVFQTSRLWRNRRERAEGIELLRRARVSVEAVKGVSFNLTTAQGRGQAGILGEVDTMETEIKAERQQLANYMAVRGGKRLRSSQRPFGYEDDHVTERPAEGDAIRWAADTLLAGGSVMSVQREWQRRGLVTAQTGRPFTRQSITTILRNPRLAGLAVYRGEILDGVTGEQAAILPEEQWRAVDALLGDPGRKPPRGVRSLLGGLAACPCGNVVNGSVNHRRDRVYNCQHSTRAGRPGPHVAVRAEPVDEYVVQVVLNVLASADLVDLVSPPPHVDTSGLRREAAAIRANLAEMGADRALGLISRAQLLEGTERGNARLAEIGGELAGAAGAGALAPFTRGQAARDVWDGLDLSRRREVIRALGTVTLHPAGRGARGFDAGKVRIESAAGEDLAGQLTAVLFWPSWSARITSPATGSRTSTRATTAGTTTGTGSPTTRATTTWTGSPSPTTSTSRRCVSSACSPMTTATSTRSAATSSTRRWTGLPGSITRATS